jgi:hypothetical protein
MGRLLGFGQRTEFAEQLPEAAIGHATGDHFAVGAARGGQFAALDDRRGAKSGGKQFVVNRTIEFQWQLLFPL